MPTVRATRWATLGIFNAEGGPYECLCTTADRSTGLPRIGATVSSPKFYDGQVVKIATMEGWGDGHEELVGSMFTVDLVGPAQHEGMWIWEYCGWIDKYDESWCFPTSLKPMDAAAQIEELAEAGVDVFNSYKS